jgi:hypothetical protein
MFSSDIVCRHTTRARVRGMVRCVPPIVPAFQAEGVPTWWLRGNVAHARGAFIKREQKKLGDGTPVGVFDAQVGEIDRHWLLIERLFGDQMIDGLRADGSQREPAEIWKELIERDKRFK